MVGVSATSRSARTKRSTSQRGLIGKGGKAKAMGP